MDLIDRDKLLRDIEQHHLSDGKFQHWVEVQPSETGWIEFQTREMDAEEKAYFLENFPDMKTFEMYCCEMPEDGQDILVSDGLDVWADVCYYDYDFIGLESTREIEPGMAWQPMPKPFRKEGD